MDQEINGLWFRKLPGNNHITVFDIAYDVRIGEIRMVAGPGPVLDTFGTTFLDWNQLGTIARFMEENHKSLAEEP